MSREIRARALLALSETNAERADTLAANDGEHADRAREFLRHRAWVQAIADRRVTGDDAVTIARRLAEFQARCKIADDALHAAEAELDARHAGLMDAVHQRLASWSDPGPPTVGSGTPIHAGGCWGHTDWTAPGGCWGHTDWTAPDWCWRDPDGTT